MFFQQLLLSIITLSLLFAPGQAPADKSYSADRFDVDLVVQEDGTLLVTERLTFRFVGGPFTYAFRHLQPDRTDGIDNIRASVDGVTYAPGDVPGYVEITGSDPIKVKWHLPETSDAIRTFELSYRVHGVVRQESGADLLAWRALPTDHEYAIAASTVRVTYPEAVALVAEPEITAGSASMERSDTTVTFDARDLEPDESLTIALHFAPGSLIATPPAWQTRSQTISQRAPIFAYVGAGVLLLGMCLLVVRLRRFRRPSARDDIVVTTPPSDLPPAIAGMLVNNGGLEMTAWSYALGTCFDLAQRGIIAIEESPRTSRWHARDFVFRLEQPSANLAPHERGLVEAFFHDKSGLQSEVPMSKLQHNLEQRLKRFSKPLKAECETRGFFDEERQRARNRLLICGGIRLFLTAGCGLATMLLYDTFSLWPLFVAGAFFVLAIVAFIAAASVSPLTDDRHWEALEWQRFSKYLRQVTRRRESLTHTTQFEGYLPYASAFGMVVSWANYLKKHENVAVPVWFRSFTRTVEGNRGAFVAMMTSSAAAGSSSTTGATGGAGAAGGGASGAG